MSWRWTQEFPSTHWEKTWSLVDEEGYGILSCDGYGNAPQRPTDKALIAAAPRLAAALKACADVLDGFAHDPKAEPYPCDCYSWTERDQEVLDEARAALREAADRSEK